MHQVILYIAQSLDGYLAKTDGSIDWLTQFGDADELAQDPSYQDLYQRIDTVLMGRKTYQQIIDELMTEMAADYFYADKTSYVVTTKTLKPRDHVILTSSDPVTLVSDLKRQSGRDIWVIGGAALIKPLVDADLIDEYQISIVPILLGDGIRLFEQSRPKVRQLRLKNAIQQGGLAYLTYERIPRD